MKTLFEAVTTYLESRNLRYSRTEDCTTIVVCYHLTNVSVNCTVALNEANRYLSFCTRSGIMVPLNKYGPAVEFLTRANFRLNVGALLFDDGDGDILFKTSVFFGDAEASPDLIRLLLSQSVNTYDRLYPGLVDVIYRDADPAQALQNVRDTNKPRPSQEDIDAAFAKLMAGVEEPQSLPGFDRIKAQAEQSSEGVLLSMKDLVNASGQQRAGKHIVRRIEESLQACGLCHEPASLPRSQTELIRVFKKHNGA